MCHPFWFAVFAFFGVVFTGLGVWACFKPSETCDVWCKALTFIGVYGVAYLATYVGILTCIPPDAIVCNGLVQGNRGEWIRVFPDILKEHVLYAMRTPFCLPCRFYNWLRTLIICCPSPEVMLVRQPPQTTSPSAPSGEPKNPC